MPGPKKGAITRAGSDGFNPNIRNGNEAEVVLGKDLSAIINNWVRIWNLERPKGQYALGEQSYGKGQEYIGAVEYLCHHSGLKERAVRRIMAGESRYPSLTTAEKLLYAIDKLYMLTNGELQVIPSPRWSQEKWVAYMQKRGCGD